MRFGRLLFYTRHERATPMTYEEAAFQLKLFIDEMGGMLLDSHRSFRKYAPTLFMERRQILEAIAYMLEKKGNEAKPLEFDPKRHRYAKLEDGRITPLFFPNGKGGMNLNAPRYFDKDDDGRWYLFDAITPCRYRIVEFLEGKE